MLPELSEQTAEPAEIQMPEENSATDDSVFEFSDEPIPFNRTDEKSADKVSESQKEVENTYRQRIVYTPLRFLALPPLHKNEKLSLDDFDRLRDAVLCDETLENLPRHRRRATDAEVIVRACHLLFALVESGGLLSGSPEREIGRLKTNLRDARAGYLQPVPQAGSSSASADIDKINESPAAEPSPESERSSGTRQPLYALGRLHLAAFVRFREFKQKAADGDTLLPKLDVGREQLKEIIKLLPWLSDIQNKSNLTWQSIFRHWLNHQFQQHGDWRGRVGWNDVTKVAAWRILQRERYPFLIAARRRLFQSVPLPDEKFTAVCNLDPPRFVRNPHSPLPSNKETGESGDVFSEDDLSPENRFDDDFESELAAPQIDEPDGEQSTSNFAFVSLFLSNWKQSQAKKRDLIKSLKTAADSPHLKGSGETDLRNLLLWTAKNIENKNKLSTAHTHAVRVLRTLFSMPQTVFADWQTSNIAEYLENYATNASVKNVRSSLELFDKFLISQGAAAALHINWRSRSLQSPVTFAARDVISNREYEQVRKVIIEDIEKIDGRSKADNGNERGELKKLQNLSLLTLLRRCGLRVGEAVWLTPRNFTGFNKWCLTIKKSKTRAGLRKLPLYLLLAENELGELRSFVKLRTQESGPDSVLFVDGDSGESLTAHALGRIAGKLLKRGGIEGETAHGLRHAFASSLFAAFWLNLTARRRKGNQSNPFLRMLKEYARPDVEGRAVTEPIYLQQLLGHADLRVTFERYIHLIELAGADAVRLSEAENGDGQGMMKACHAAYLMGMDVRLFAEEFDCQPNEFSDLIKIADAAVSRIS